MVSQSLKTNSDSTSTPKMRIELRQAFDREMRAAVENYNADVLDTAFYHLERAHILGQCYVITHTATHWWMLKVGWRRRDSREIKGQIFRIVAALIISRIWVPIGNTGGANVHPLKSMPIPEEFRDVLNTG